MSEFFKTMELIYSNTMKEYIIDKSNLIVKPKDITILGVSATDDCGCICINYKICEINAVMNKLIPESELDLLELKNKFRELPKYVILSAHTKYDGKWLFWTDEDYTDNVKKAGLYSKEYVDNLLGVDVCETSLDFEIILNRNKYISSNSGQLVLDTDTAIPASLITTILGKEQTVIFV